MLDQQHVEAVVVAGIDEGFQRVVRLFGGQRCRDEAEALGYTLDVRINGHGREAEREEQNAGSGFRPHAGQRPEPLSRVFEFHLAQEVEVPALGALRDCPEASLDARRLLLREATGGDGFDDLLEWCVCDLFPGAEAAKELRERATAVRVGRVLRQNREHQFGHGIAMGSVHRHAVEDGQALHDDRGRGRHQSFNIRAARPGSRGTRAASRA